jgi:hypothetical protein
MFQGEGAENFPCSLYAKISRKSRICGKFGASRKKSCSKSHSHSLFSKSNCIFAARIKEREVHNAQKAYLTMGTISFVNFFVDFLGKCSGI